MEPSESGEVFINWFLHLCCKFPEGVVDLGFITENFQCLILLSFSCFESKPLMILSPPNLGNHGTPKYYEEEPIIPFVPCPPLFPIPIWVPPGDQNKVGRSKNQTVDLSIQPPSNSYDLHPTKEILEWFINFTMPKVKVDPPSFQYHINAHKYNLEFGPNKSFILSGDVLKPLPPMFHDSLFHNPLVSPASTYTYVQFVVSSGNQE